MAEIRLLASSGTVEGMERCINAYVYSESWQVAPETLKVRDEARQGQALSSRMRVIRKRGRYRLAVAMDGVQTSASTGRWQHAACQTACCPECFQCVFHKQHAIYPARRQRCSHAHRSANPARPECLPGKNGLLALRCRVRPRRHGGCRRRWTFLYGRNCRGRSRFPRSPC